RPLPALVLLESARPGRNARWTYLAADPVAIIEAPSAGADVSASAGRLLARIAADVLDDTAAPPFTGGLAGFLGYDLGRHLERLPSLAAAHPALPPMRLAPHLWVIAGARRVGRAWLAARAVDELVGRLDRRLA